MAIESAGRPLNPHEILDEAQRDVPELGISTVYRTLKLLLEAGEIDLVMLPGQVARYEAPRIGPRHYFLCRSCQRAYVLKECKMDVSKVRQHSVESHEVTLHGLCSQCKPGRKKNSRDFPGDLQSHFRLQGIRTATVRRNTGASR